MRRWIEIFHVNSLVKKHDIMTNDDKWYPAIGSAMTYFLAATNAVHGHPNGHGRQLHQMSTLMEEILHSGKLPIGNFM